MAERNCYKLKVCAPYCHHHQNSYDKALTPSVMVFGGVAFQRSLGLDKVMKVGFLQGGEDGEISLPLSLCLGAFTKERPREDTVGRQLSTNLEESALQEPDLHLDLGLASPRTVSNECVLVKLSVYGILLGQP